MRTLDSLVAGFGRFRGRYFDSEPALFERLRRGQSPTTLVIACCDSRVDPALVLDADPGDLFVIRNVANLVPPPAHDGGTHGVSAALEFGVRTLRVRDVIVLGHAQCGGIRALLDGTAGEYVPQWMSIAARARERVLSVGAGDPRACELAAIGVSLEHLRAFEFVREGVERGALGLHGWYFDLDRGELLAVDAASGAWKPLVAGTSETLSE